MVMKSFPVNLSHPMWSSTVGIDRVNTTKSFKPRRKTVWEKASMELSKSSKAFLEKGATKEYYIGVSPELLTATFGKIKPVYRGVPKKLPLELLTAGAGDAKLPLFYWYKAVGLVYITPYIIGRKSKRCRLTHSGLMLLDHWASTSPSFKRFVDAYISKQARDTIIKESFDLHMGVLPARFETDIATNKRLFEKQEKLLADAEFIQRQKAVYAQSVHSRHLQMVKAQQASPIGQPQSVSNVPQGILNAIWGKR